MKRISVLMLLLYTCLVSSAWLQAQAAHKIVKFDVPGAGKSANQGTVGGGIVADGSIMGWYTDSKNVSHGYLRSPVGKFTKFDPRGSVNTYSIGMNSSLAIVGYYIDSNGVRHGFLRTPDGKIAKLDAPQAGKSSGQGTTGTSINTKGEIVGYFVDSNGLIHGFLRSPGGKISKFDDPDAGTASGQGTEPTTFDALTDAGAIAGQYYDSTSAPHGFLRAPGGRFTNFDPPGSADTFSTGINSKSAIVGVYLDANGFHSFLRNAKGKITSFDVKNSQTTAATNINSDGAITGDYVDSNNVCHGFLRAPNGTITVFRVPGAGFGVGQGTFPYSNNATDAISGTYIDSNNVNHGFLRK